MIRVTSLSKNYGGHLAVSDLSFAIEKGKIYGFLGPNGAGKSTTMNIITGCLAATSGQVLIGGHDICAESVQAKRLIGYLPEQPPLYGDMTVAEYLGFAAAMKGLRAGERRSQIQAVMEKTAIDDVSHRLIRHLSKGYKQRVGVAQAILGKPEVVILDEPTVGLDPKQIMEIRELIRSLGGEHTVILSSHILSEVRAVCDRVIILSRGKLVAEDTPENLEKLFAGNSSLSLRVKGCCRQVEEITAGIAGVQKLQCAMEDNGVCAVEIMAAEDIAEDVFFAFADKRVPIIAMQTAHASLEDVFLELTNGEGGEEP